LFLGGRNHLGISRDLSGQTATKWKSVQGTILDVTVGSAGGTTATIPLILVVKDRGSIRSRLYEFNYKVSSLTHRDTLSNSWVHGGSGRFYRQSVGLNTPLEPGIRKVELRNDQIIDLTTPQTYEDISVYSPSYQIMDQRIFSLARDGSLRIYHDGKQRLRTPEKYGGSPVTLSARRGESVININPEFAVWKHTVPGRYRLVLPHNPAGGLTLFRGLTTYNESRLYLLETDGNTIERLWESKRLPGYVSSVVRTGEGTVLTLVDTENDSTRLLRAEPRGLN
ncbi:MAG: hypothetical protein ABEK50_16025, partial [bacterium]